SCSSSYLAAVQLLSSNVVVTLCQCGQEGHLGDEKRRREGPNLHAGAMQGPGSQCPSSLRGPGEWRSRSQRLGRCPRGGGMGDHSPGAQSQGGDVTASDADTCHLRIGSISPSWTQGDGGEASLRTFALLRCQR
ncbi:unnamed protein product, partial [Effrenium voratum]